MSIYPSNLSPNVSKTQRDEREISCGSKTEEKRFKMSRFEWKSDKRTGGRLERGGEELLHSRVGPEPPRHKLGFYLSVSAGLDVNPPLQVLD